MKRESLIFFLGCAMVLLPFLGIPSAWKRGVYVVLGLVLILVGYQLRRLAYVRSIEDHAGERKTDVYVEQVEQLFVKPSIPLGRQGAEQEERETHRDASRRQSRRTGAQDV